MCNLVFVGSFGSFGSFDSFDSFGSFVFVGVLFFLFPVFWFVVGCLKGWQNNTKVKDLDLDLTLCQFSHFRGCKRAFG